MRRPLRRLVPHRRAQDRALLLHLHELSAGRDYRDGKSLLHLCHCMLIIIHRHGSSKRMDCHLIRPAAHRPIFCQAFLYASSDASAAAVLFVHWPQGAVSCLGNTLDEIKDSLYNCKSGLTPCQEFADIGMKSQICGQPTPEVQASMYALRPAHRLAPCATALEGVCRPRRCPPRRSLRR